MYTDIYNWLFELFFSGELPAIIQPVANECCCVLSFVVLGFILLLPIWLIFKLASAAFSGLWRF